jgi:hypothetical protein
MHICSLKLEVSRMTHHSDAPIQPRNGHTLVVGVVARISGCANQKELSLEDQEDHAKQVVAELFDGPIEYRTIKTKGKGERLDRPELADIEAMLRSRELDLLVAEDIGRLIRGTDAARLCGIAVDHGTRLLAPNDCIDTAEDSWEEDVISACRDHVGHNAHTSKRIKHKKMNRFKKFGGATPCEIFGYLKPAGAKTYDDWQKDETAAPIYAEWFGRLRETQNCSAVADWLNRSGVPTGRYSRRKTWDGPMVRRITRNPLLKGMPGRGFKHTIKHHETGRRISVPNPKGPVFREYPHLVHVDHVEFDAVNALLDAANRGFRRKPINAIDPLWRVPRKRTRFPGQHARCFYCGRHYVWGGNGLTEYLVCNGSRDWKCWNSVGFSGAAAVVQVSAALTAKLAALDGFDDQIRALVEQAGRDGGTDLVRSWAELTRDEEASARLRENMLTAIAERGPMPMLKEKLEDLEARQRELVRRRRELEGREKRTLQLPESAAELRRLFEEKFRGLAQGSPEFGDLLRQVVPEFCVYLVRLCDGGHLLPRARIKVNLAGIAPDSRHAPELETLLARELTLDLFEPPQREQIRADAVDLMADGLDQRQIARRLGVTQPAVSKAILLDRLMRQRGLDTPYEIVTAPPADYRKLRRHVNPNYCFEPAEGYQPPTL